MVVSMRGNCLPLHFHHCEPFTLGRGAVAIAQIFFLAFLALMIVFSSLFTIIALLQTILYVIVLPVHLTKVRQVQPEENQVRRQLCDSPRHYIEDRHREIVLAEERIQSLIFLTASFLYLEHKENNHIAQHINQVAD